MFVKDDRKGLALIHLTFEGFQVQGGGVCTVIQGHLGALPLIKQALHSRSKRLTPFFCETLYAPSVPGYDEKQHKKAKALLKEMGGDLLYLLNSTQTGLPISCNWQGGENFFGTRENLLAASISGATLARNIALSYERAVVYCHDAAFVLAPLIGAMQAKDERIQWIWVVHSTSHTHDAPPLNPHKVGMESACVNGAREYPNIYLGAISGFIRNHLIKEYGASSNRIIPTGNGVNPLDPKYRIREPKEIQRKIDAVNRSLPIEDRIPSDKPLVLSYGRPVPYKRLDLTLRASARYPGLFYPVIVTLGDCPELRQLRSRLEVPCAIINAFDFELVACLCQHEKTEAVAILARNEPFGLIPSEIRLLARKKEALLLVPVDGGGLSEQVDHGVDGFVLQDVEELSSIPEALEQIRSLAPAQANGIRSKGLERVFKEGYTWSSRILETLACVDPDVAALKDEVVSEMAKAEKGALEPHTG